MEPSADVVTPFRVEAIRRRRRTGCQRHPRTTSAMTGVARDKSAEPAPSNAQPRTSLPRSPRSRRFLAGSGRRRRSAPDVARDRGHAGAPAPASSGTVTRKRSPTSAVGTSNSAHRTPGQVGAASARCRGCRRAAQGERPVPRPQGRRGCLRARGPSLIQPRNYAAHRLARNACGRTEE